MAIVKGFSTYMIEIMIKLKEILNRDKCMAMSESRFIVFLNC